MRGLSLNPEDWFPSMDALLRRRSREQQRRGQRRGAIAAVGALALAAAGVGVYAYQQSRVCAGSEELVASVWGPAAHQKLQAAFTATGKPFAAEAAAKVVNLLDGYARAGRACTPRRAWPRACAGSRRRSCSPCAWCAWIAAARISGRWRAC